MQLNQKSKTSTPKLETLRNGLYRLRYYENSKRVSRTFKSRIDAQCHLDSLTQELALPISFQISMEDRALFSLFKNNCERYGISTQSAFNRLDEILRIEHSPKCISLEKCVEKYNVYMKNINLRGRTIQDNNYNIGRFVDAVGATTNVHIITPEIIANFISTMTSKKHILRRLKAFFAFLKRDNIIAENIASSVKLDDAKEDETLPVVLSVNDTKRIFMFLKGKKEILYYALLAFAGIRPEELVSRDKNKSVLDWAHINLKAKIITISGEVSKTRTTRNICNISQNLLDLLNSIPAKERVGRVIKQSHKTIARSRSQIPICLEQDVFRHCFASYGYYFYGSDAILDYMGHAGNKVFNRHYKGLSNAISATDYFNIKLI